MLLPRIITAIIGVPLVLSCIYFGDVAFSVFTLAIVVLCLYEYWLVLWMGSKPIHLVPLVFFGLLVAVAAILGRTPLQSGQPDMLLPLSFTVAILGVVLWELFSPRRSLERLAFTFLGVFFIPWGLAHMVCIRDVKPHGLYLTMMLFIPVWVGDTAAYFVGKRFGKNKLMEAVSPKKTWEGAAAGFLGSLVIMAALNALFPIKMSLSKVLIMGALVGVMGQLSDLAESMIKRSVGVKDSSSLLPGHGGVLDRFDSYLLLAPLFYYCFLIVK